MARAGKAGSKLPASKSGSKLPHSKRALHSVTAREINRQDAMPGRKGSRSREQAPGIQSGSKLPHSKTAPLYSGSEANLFFWVLNQLERH